jgi:hypothetical protein
MFPIGVENIVVHPVVAVTWFVASKATSGIVIVPPNLNIWVLNFPHLNDRLFALFLTGDNKIFVALSVDVPDIGFLLWVDLEITLTEGILDVVDVSRGAPNVIPPKLFVMLVLCADTVIAISIGLASIPSRCVVIWSTIIPLVLRIATSTF